MMDGVDAVEDLPPPSAMEWLTITKLFVVEEVVEEMLKRREGVEGGVDTAVQSMAVSDVEADRSGVVSMASGLRSLSSQVKDEASGWSPGACEGGWEGECR